MTHFKASLSICGLSQAQAAEFLHVNINTIKSWGAGRENPPLGVWRQLASLFRQIRSAAEGAADIMVLDGVNPRAWNNLEADLTDDALPIPGALQSARTMALLMAIDDRTDAEGEKTRQPRGRRAI